MTEVLLFPFHDYWGFYAGFTLFVLFVLILDLGVFHRKAHVVSVKESTAWSVIWVSLALLFNLGFFYYAKYQFSQDVRLNAIPDFDALAAAKQVALEFFAGYVIEKSLAVDNIFVFVVVFSYFAIPKIYQHRILFFGILGALALRAVFIALGASLLQYHWVLIVAGVFLIFTGIKILVTSDKPADIGSNILIKWVRRVLPVSNEIRGKEFFVRENGVIHATPLFLALVFIEFSDIIFAIDSVPAIFAVSKEPLIVFTSNIFAILGLRSLYFLLAGVVDKFRFLKYGLGLILIFVGLKMTWLNDAFDGKFPITWSLGIILGILAGTIALSIWIKPKDVAAQ